MCFTRNISLCRCREVSSCRGLIGRPLVSEWLPSRGVSPALSSPPGSDRTASLIRGECGAAPGAPRRNDGDRQWCDSRHGTHWGPFHVKHPPRPSKPEIAAIGGHPARLEFARDYPGPCRLAPNGDVHPVAAASQDRSARVRSLSVSRETSHSLARAHDLLGWLPIRTSTAGKETLPSGTIAQFQDTPVSRPSSRPLPAGARASKWRLPPVGSTAARICG